MAAKLFNIEKRLAFLKNLLTTPGVDEKIPHAERVQLTEEAEELYQKADEMKKNGYVNHNS